MSTLKERIETLRHMTHDYARSGKYFVQPEELYSSLSDDDIREAFKAIDSPVDKLDEWEERVRSGAKKTFAILVTIDGLHLFSNFIASDQFQKSEKHEMRRLDDLLPRPLSKLEEIFGMTSKMKSLLDEKTTAITMGSDPPALSKKTTKLLDQAEVFAKFAKDFHKEQFSYCAPSFQKQSSHRTLEDQIILPFLKEEDIPFVAEQNDDEDDEDDEDEEDEDEDGDEIEVEERQARGSFGTVYKVTLPGSFFESNDETVCIARKELDSTGNNYQNEVRVLNILNLIHHPNILELYCSYTYQNKHSLLFPLAGGDLDYLLSRNERNPEFKSNESFFIALCGLSFGLKQVHQYSNLSLKLDLIGAHHDLKPNNILIRGSRFVLADFGLSRMKDKGSKTMYQGGGDYSAAPESQGDNLDAHEVGRASDIWSLGCIFAVILVYLKRKAVGVKRFQRRRRYAVPNYNIILYTFHQGKGTVNPAVTTELDGIRSDCSPAEQAFLDLVWKMLELTSVDRPKIDRVLSILRHITLRKLSETIEKAISVVPKAYHGRLVFDIERITFEEWFGEIKNMNSDSSEAKHICDDSKFDVLVDTLQNLERELRRLETANMDPATYPIFLPMQRLVQLLITSLLKDMQQSVRSRAEARILEGLSSGVDVRSELDEGSESHSRILQLFNIKYMQKQTTELTDTSIRLDPGDLQPPDKNNDSFLTFAVRRTRATEFDPGRKVIVETLEYGKDIQNEAASQQIFDRMVNIMHLPKQYTELRGLKCNGFYRDLKQFGLVYEIPWLEESSEPVVTTLAHIFETVEVQDVSLSDRLRLAQDLGTAIFEFHKIQWLHKGISSHNVIFISDSLSGATKLVSPYITGFSHSRPNDISLLSNLAYGGDEELRAYLHPDYRRDEIRKYVAEYDYYSLGLILLEIGCWLPLKTLIEVLKGKGKGTSTDTLREGLISMAETLLPSTIGLAYSAVVSTCLGDKLKGDKIGLKFEELVVRPLKSCSI